MDKWYYQSWIIIYGCCVEYSLIITPTYESFGFISFRILFLVGDSPNIRTNSRTWSSDMVVDENVITFLMILLMKIFRIDEKFVKEKENWVSERGVGPWKTYHRCLWGRMWWWPFVLCLLMVTIIRKWTNFVSFILIIKIVS